MGQEKPTCRLFQPSQIFAGKDEAYLIEAPFSALYYKHMMIVNNDSSIISK